MKVLKIIGIILSVIVIGVTGIGLYVKMALPDVGPAQSIDIEATDKREQRGKYLANHVAVCMDCHSTRNWELFAGPMIPENQGGGGEAFGPEMGFPGTFYARNITPYALGNWTDGEIIRAITTGVNKQGEALFPLMAYHRFGKMDKEDIYSIVVYLRGLRPVQRDIPARKIDFPLNFIVNTIPQPAEFTELPKETDRLMYGKYLINAAGCVDCHSQTDKGKVVPGTEFGGGMEFAQRAGIIRSPNITFDAATGIGTWTKETFVSRFKTYTDSNHVAQKVAPGELNTPMPWSMYAGMQASDLEAIYDYLKSIPPMTHQVVRMEKKK